MLRRACSGLALLGLVALTVPGTASATPIVSIKGRAVPIPGFPHTGNILGAGAAVLAEGTIQGTEYGGFPPPVIGVNAYLPAGVKLHPQGFPTCTADTLRNGGARACPAKSAAGPVGEVLGVVSFGSERVEEKATVQAFFAPGGGLNFLGVGSNPVSLEVVAPGHFVNAPRPYGPELITTVPLIETVPGAPDASALSLRVIVGAAIKKGKKTIYYGTVPKTCPKGGFPAKAEVLFAGLGGLAPQTVTATFKAPCPRGSSKRGRGARRPPHGRSRRH